MLYINEIQHLESFCTRDSCLENSTKCVIFLPLEGLKRHVWPLFRCFFLYFAHLLAVLNFSIPTLLGRSFVAKWQVSLQKKGVTGSNPWVGKPSYGEVSRLASEQKSSGEGLRRPLWQIREGVVVRSWGCCGAVMRVLWCGHEGVMNHLRQSAEWWTDTYDSSVLCQLLYYCIFYIFLFLISIITPTSNDLQILPIECRRQGGEGPVATDGKRRERFWILLTKSRKKCSEIRLFWN